MYCRRILGHSGVCYNTAADGKQKCQRKRVPEGFPLELFELHEPSPPFQCSMCNVQCAMMGKWWEFILSICQVAVFYAKRIKNSPAGIQQGSNTGLVGFGRKKIGELEAPFSTIAKGAKASVKGNILRVLLIHRKTWYGKLYATVLKLFCQLGGIGR